MINFLKGELKGYDPAIKNWDEPTTREFNGEKVEGRPTKGYGTKTFVYAGKTYKPTKWTPSILQVKMATESLVSKELDRIVRFNFCLCGLYKTGQISIPHHSDTVPTLEDLVVGVSFGASRILEWNQYYYQIKRESNTSKINILHENNYLGSQQYLLEDGDVYIFDGNSQMTSTHAIPSMEDVGKRISLTFRTGL
jgi:alkylated DNA repair dioxygenase AlkB|tara:strand:+ start:6595 stop:7179 length:585 start_codon:yes stop_codon:yes gene_type:complete